jgi:hypothetical protein
VQTLPQLETRSFTPDPEAQDIQPQENSNHTIVEVHDIFTNIESLSFEAQPKRRSRSLKETNWSLFEEDTIAPKVVESPLVLLGIK